MGISSFVKDIAKGTVNNLLGGGPNGAGDSNPKGLKSGIVQDWTHATKVFVGGDMIRAPKYKGLFHVNFIINEDAFKAGLDPLKGQVRDTLSVLTKSIELPKFNMEYSSLNQYNHASYNYKKIKYDPVTVTFHDDMSDIVTTFWYFYYAYYFADGSKTYDARAAGDNGKGGGLFAGLVNKATKAISSAITGGLKKLLGKKDSNGNKTEGTPTAEEAPDAYEAFRKYANGIVYGDKGEKKIEKLHYSWGLNGSAYHVNGGREKNIPFLKAIEIYPLGNKQASMIVLHNPKIVSWAGDTFDYSAQGTATCTATIVYEGVTYKDQIDAKTILDDVQMYDRHGAPGSGKTGGLFSFIDKVDGILGKAQRGEALTGGDIITGLGAVKSLFKKKGSGG
jgi:hypothetical protein